MRITSITLPLLFLLLRQAIADEPVLPTTYSKGDAVSIECLDRTIDNGEHVLDPTGKLQYSPFAKCNETDRPLELRFLEGEDREFGLNCTIPTVSDEMYHLLEFYVHHDSPLSCRVRARPKGEGELAVEEGEEGALEEWVPLIFALAGNMDMSHLHIAMSMNLLVHTTAGSEGVIDSAAAYATSAQQSTRFVIGDPLPLKFRVRWVEGPVLPRVGFVSGEAEGAGKVLLFCVLSALVGAAGCYAWVVGVDLPRRMKRRSAAQGGIIGNFGAGEKGRGAGYGGYSGAGVNGGGAGNGAYGYGGKRKD